MMEFAAGYAFGITSVIVGQPLDTIKTRIQASTNVKPTSMMVTAREIFQKEGIRGLYRGGLPMVLGGGLIRSTQFGVNAKSLSFISEYRLIDADSKWFGFIRPNVVAAGLCGGFCRGLVEGPIELFKVRRQVVQTWKFNEVLNGTGFTVFRNTWLFALFVVYVDISKQIVPGGLGSFWTGAVCASAAWFTVWPIDVIKTQIQSGHFKGKSIFTLTAHLFATGQIYRGILPGLVRSTFSNGASMVVYDKTLEVLRPHRQDAN